MMYQIFFSPDGVRQHEMNSCSHIQYWNDACWHRAIPANTTGLTYLDVGSHAGYFCLRFEQRGGSTTGIDFCLAKIIDSASEVDNIGQEHTHSEYQWVKDQYQSKYKLLVGGFDVNGQIVPSLGKFNIISCMNVLEYLPNPKECIATMFQQATDRVIINLDINPNEPTKPITDVFPMKWLCGLEDVLSWCLWPNVYWVYDIGTKDCSQYQLFLVATNPRSNLEIDNKKIKFDLDLPETEKFYRKG